MFSSFLGSKNADDGTRSLAPARGVWTSQLDSQGLATVTRGADEVFKGDPKADAATEDDEAGSRLSTPDVEADKPEADPVKVATAKANEEKVSWGGA